MVESRLIMAVLFLACLAGTALTLAVMARLRRRERRRWSRSGYTSPRPWWADK